MERHSVSPGSGRRDMRFCLSEEQFKRAEGYDSSETELEHIRGCESCNAQVRRLRLLRAGVPLLTPFSP